MTIPESAKKFLTKSSVTNCGTAMVTINNVLQNLFNLMSLELISSAMRCPSRKFDTVARNAHKKVHSKIFLNAYPKEDEVVCVKSFTKFLNPTQVNSSLGGK